MGNDSIYFEKCECGKRIDYWKLRHKLINENRKSTSKLFYLLMLVSSIGFIFVLYHIFTFNSISSNYPYEIGIMYGFGLGAFFGIVFISIQDYRRIRKYNPKHKKQRYYRSKIKWAYYHSLPKSKKKSLISAYVLMLSIVVIPYFAIVFAMIYFMGNTISEQGIIAIFIGYIIYFAWWKIDPLMKHMVKWTEKNLKSKGIDYQRFNKGVKSID